MAVLFRTTGTAPVVTFPDLFYGVSPLVMIHPQTIDMTGVYDFEDLLASTSFQTEFTAGTIELVDSVTGTPFVQADLDNISASIGQGGGLGLSNLQTDVANNTSSIGTLQTDVANNTSSIGTLQTDVANNTSSIGTLQTNSNLLSSHLGQGSYGSNSSVFGFQNDITGSFYYEHDNDDDDSDDSVSSQQSDGLVMLSPDIISNLNGYPYSFTSPDTLTFTENMIVHFFLNGEVRIKNNRTRAEYIQVKVFKNGTEISSHYVDARFIIENKVRFSIQDAIDVSAGDTLQLGINLETRRRRSKPTEFIISKDKLKWSMIATLSEPV